jgi:hypothetical protein
VAAVFRLTLKAAAAAFNVTFSIVIWLAKVSRLRKLKSGILVKVHLFDSFEADPSASPVSLEWTIHFLGTTC